jgi:hypothetical protein
MIKKRTFAFFTAIFGLLAWPALVFAQKASEQFNRSLESTAGKTGHKGLSISNMEFAEIVGYTISFLLSLVGIVFLLLMIYSGLQWMTAAGNEDRVFKARDTIKNGLIGLVLIFSAYAITKFIGSLL